MSYRNEIAEKAKECVLNQLQLIEDAAKNVSKQVDGGQCPTEAIKGLSEATSNLMVIIGGYGLQFNSTEQPPWEETMAKILSKED